MAELYKGEDHAILYKKHRPDMDESMVQAIISFLGKKFTPSECDAADVGCGSGQGTLPLAPFLRHIVGLDPSEAQISQIKTETKIPDNVEFRVGEAENLPFEDCSLHLVIAKSALHWFDIPKFFKEVDRILKPGGVLAVTCSRGFSNVVGHEEEVKELIQTIAKDYRTDEWNERFNIVSNAYKSVQFPYKECIRDDSYGSDHTTTVRQLMELAQTRSDIAKFQRENPEEAKKALRAAEAKLMKIIGAAGIPEDATLIRRAQYVLILCRKP